MRDLIVGAFVLAGLVALGYLSFSLGGLEIGGAKQINVSAAFDEIGGLSERASVVVAGVPVGTVTGIQLDGDYRAVVTMSLPATLEIPSDSSAAILTQGVLGSQYVGLEPGADDTMLQDGDEMTFTQSAIVLERLIGKLVNSLGGSE
jgi:phospholipid/cholesterol/gamma-HCH transport system substrate-binding protein